MKTYGIYVCYPPTVVLQHEGLGRYMAALIKGAANNKEVKFCIVCPSWSKDDLYDLFESEDVPLDSVEIHSPKERPIILRLHNALHKFRQRRSKKKVGVVGKAIRFIKRYPLTLLKKIELRIARAYSIFSLIPAVFYGVVLFLMFLFVLPFAFLAALLSYGIRRVKRSSVNRYYGRLKNKVTKLFDNPKDDGLVLNLYQSMLSAETERMQDVIENLKSIHAWYCPTAFWDSFSKIDAPRLLCVPDVVLTRFPGGFSQVGGERFLETFRIVERTINLNDYFVTYSNDVKDKTLVEHYNVDQDNVYVIQHAPNKLDNWLTVTGFQDIIASTNYYAERLFSVALAKNADPYVRGLGTDIKFIFYASQFRPNKNIISLLKAYHYLLTKKFIQHKLILTGFPERLESVKDYVKNNNLERDVLFMTSLSVQELAACYKLADLAVNPTLSEGGCPFTYTEALSVGTPVVMGRIGVTEEVLTDPKLQEMSFFDPYDWKSIADKIEWALDNLEPLKEIQLKTYDQLVKRTWEDVVDEHILALDEVAQKFHAKRSQLSE